jgi:hypothetical protein
VEITRETLRELRARTRLGIVDADRSQPWVRVRTRVVIFTARHPEGYVPPDPSPFVLRSTLVVAQATVTVTPPAE